ncbi:Hypothetical protein D9617_4g002840 [Elsinoe fawcettii]|nr:Hypothetical protein D9617_4g002840 [Elsinoe fawcettii]
MTGSGSVTKYCERGNLMSSGRAIVPLAGLDMAAAIHEILRLDIAFEHEWVFALCEGYTDALIALCLVFMSGLETLSTDPNFMWPSTMTGKLFRAMPRGACLHCPSLTRITIGEDWKQRRDGLDPHVFNYPVTLAWPGEPPIATGLRSLEVQYIREKDIGMLLKATPNLEKFVWDWSYTERMPQGMVNNVVDLEQISDALMYVSSSLRELKITAEAQGEVDLDPYLFLRGDLCGINGLRSLERLDMPLWFLLKWSPGSTPPLADFLPNNLTDLVITDCMWPLRCHVPGIRENREVKLDQWNEPEILSLVQGFLTIAPQTHPKLKTLKLDLWQLDDDDDCLTLWERLKLLDGTNGIRLKFPPPGFLHGSEYFDRKD